MWLSSLWSEATYTAFRKALNVTLKAQHPTKVRAILELWVSAKKISREQALDFQLNAILKARNSNFAVAACNLESAMDRVEYLRYYRTKALFEDVTTTVGSVVMNSVCESIGIK